MVYHVQPFMLVGLGVLFFAERLSAAKVGWLLLAFAGLMLFVSAKGSGQATGADYLLGVSAWPWLRPFSTPWRRRSPSASRTCPRT